MLTREMFFRAMLVVVAVALSVPVVQAANLVLNGDFEDTTGWGAPGTMDCPLGWYSGTTSMKNPADIQADSAAIGGTGTSAYMPAFKTSTTSERRQMGQVLSSDADWSFSMDVAAEYAGSATDRSLQLILQPETGSRMMFRIVDSLDGGMGAFEFYRGSQGGWTPLPGLESCITYSTDLQNTPLAHAITISGQFDQAAPAYTVSIEDPYGNVFATPSVDWFESGSAPSQGSGLAYFTLPTFNSLGNYAIDNVSVPGSSGDLVGNGDFEDTTDWGAAGTAGVPASWEINPALRKNPAAVQTGATAIGGQGTSAYCPANPTSNEWEKRQMYHDLETPSEAEWTLELDAACTNSGDPTLRVLNFFAMTQSNKRMLFRVVGSDTGNRGAVQFYRGSQGAWTSIPGLEEAFDFSTDVTTSALVNHLALSGDFTSESPTWDISVTDSSGATLSVNDMDWFESGTLPAVGDGIRQLAFSFMDCNGDVLLDNITIPDGTVENTPGDANLDGYVDVSDLGILATNYGTTSGAEWGDADFTGDGAVDVSDLGLLATNYGTEPSAQAVPEPSCLVLLLSICGIMMQLRRRK